MKRKILAIATSLLALTLMGTTFINPQLLPVPVSSIYLENDLLETDLVESPVKFVVAPAVETIQLPLLNTFAESVRNSQSDLLTGVYVPGLFALPVLQQPSGQAAYVHTSDESVTQFAMASNYNNVGLLAHNYLSGEEFFKLKPGQYVILVFGDGSLAYYRITSAQSFQALSPNSPFSDFVDLSDSQGTRISSTTLFKKIYTQGDQVIFQTCIKAFGDPSWGRLFVTAEKVDVRQPIYLANQ